MSDIFYDLPCRASRYGESGWIYMVAFDNPAKSVKVGSSASPRARIMEHRNMADCYGIGIADMWLSPEHFHYVETEQALIHLARKVSERSARKEYFLGVDWDGLCSLANTIAFDLVPHDASARPNTYRAIDLKRASDRARWIGLHGPDSEVAS